MTHIAIALGLCNQISHLTPWCGYDLIDIDHCLNSRLMRREGPIEYKIVILSDVVHQFTVPNPERTSAHNHDNLCYPLEIQDESLTPPPTPHAPEYHPTPSFDFSSSYSDGPPPIGKRHTKLQTIQTSLHHS